jgi:hypothetical protein
MKKSLLVIAAVGALALSACSSDATSDSTPGSGNPNPQVTDHNPNPNDGSFCAMIASSEDMSNDLNDSMDTLNDIIDDQDNWDSPEAVAALHDQGQLMIQYADDVADVFDQAAKETGDPEVASAFTSLAEYFRVLFKGMGQAAADSNSVMDYLMNMGTYLDQDQLADMVDELDEAGPIVSQYILETCGDSGFDFSD